MVDPEAVALTTIEIIITSVIGIASTEEVTLEGITLEGVTLKEVIPIALILYSQDLASRRSIMFIGSQDASL